jgi:hypothetical protein
MNLFSSEPYLRIKLDSYARKLRPPATNIVPIHSISRLIVIGDGTPDDYVAFIICHYLNGDITIGTIKPPSKRGKSTFTLLRDNIYYFKQLSKVLFLLDEETDRCEDIIENFELQCRKQKIDIIQRQNYENGHLYVAQCTCGDRNLDIIVVINGLDDINSDAHTIEDHLIKTASELGMKQLPDRTFNSKDIWNSLSQKEQEDIFSKLIKSTNADKIFPQQIKGFKLLK